MRGFCGALLQHERRCMHVGNLLVAETARSEMVIAI